MARALGLRLALSRTERARRLEARLDDIENAQQALNAEYTRIERQLERLQRKGTLLPIAAQGRAQ